MIRFFGMGGCVSKSSENAFVPQVSVVSIEKEQEHRVITTSEEFLEEFGKMKVVLCRKLAVESASFQDFDNLFSCYLEAIRAAPVHALELAIEENVIDLDLFVQMGQLPDKVNAIEQIQIVFHLLHTRLRNPVHQDKVMSLRLEKVFDPSDDRSCYSLLYIVRTILMQVGDPAQNSYTGPVMDGWIHNRRMVVALTKIRLEKYLKEAIRMINLMILYTVTGSETLADILLEENYLSYIDSVDCMREWKVEIAFLVAFMTDYRPKQSFTSAMSIMGKVLANYDPGESDAAQPLMFRQCMSRIIRQLVALNRPEIDAWLEACDLWSPDPQTTRLID